MSIEDRLNAPFHEERKKVEEIHEQRRKEIEHKVYLIINDSFYENNKEIQGISQKYDLFKKETKKEKNHSNNILRIKEKNFMMK